MNTSSLGAILFLVGILLLIVVLYVLAEINTRANAKMDNNHQGEAGESLNGAGTIIDPSDKYMKSIGKWMFIIGIVLTVILQLSVRHIVERLDNPGYVIIFRLTFIAIALYGLNLYREYYQKTMPKALDVLDQDDRKPVLFLRSFERDNFGSFKIKKSFWEGMSLNPETHMLDKNNIEQIIVKTIQPFGPVIAIGKPGENLPPIGAYRHYTATDENWQKTVLDFIDKAALIVIVLDFSEGVLWELRQIILKKRLRDTIILYPTTLGVYRIEQHDDPWFQNFEKYKAEFPFLVNPLDGTLGILFSSMGKPVELWINEPDMKERFEKVGEILIDWFKDRPVAENSILRVGIPVKK